MLTALMTVYAGLELYKWIIIAVLAVMLVVGLFKKLIKLAITVVILVAIYMGLSYMGMLPF